MWHIVNTVVYFGVGESGMYIPRGSVKSRHYLPPLRLITVNY